MGKSKFFPVRVDPFEKGGKESENSRIASSKVYPFILVMFKYFGCG